MTDDQTPPEPADNTHDDPVPVTGALKMQLIDEDGNVIEERNVDNLVTTLGKNGIADQILEGGGRPRRPARVSWTRL